MWPLYFKVEEVTHYIVYILASNLAFWRYVLEAGRIGKRNDTSDFDKGQIAK